MLSLETREGYSQIQTHAVLFPGKCPVIPTAKGDVRVAGPDLDGIEKANIQ
jgi:hypothetical protein